MQPDTPVTAPNTGTSPLAWYRSARLTPGWIEDAEQTAAVEALDALWRQLVEFKARRNHFLGRSLLSPDVPKGLYLWGGVGRGKTFLMDGFYACVPYKRKRRVHFHTFMVEAHQRMKQLAGHSDPLIAWSDSIAASTRLLCLDEFHVDDIADAMILGRLLAALLARGVIVVTTSNYPPSGLYPHGLQRQNFLPAIALLEDRLTVLGLGTGNDYRMLSGEREMRYIVPADAFSTASMQAMFQRHHPLPPDAESPIPARRIARGAAWFDFREICAGAHGQGEYLAIAQRFHTVYLSAIPQLGPEQSAEARRLTWLVDVLYDHHVQLVVSAATTPEALYLQGTGATEFARTASRLVEMQSKRYAQLPHHRAAS